MLSAANISEVNMRNSRTWEITALFSPSVHPSLQYSRELSIQYIRNFLTSRLHHIQRTENNMHSITLLSFLYPRQFRASAAVPVIVILHFSNSIRFPTIQALLGHGTVGITATCTPVDFGEGKPCPDVSLHPIFATFLRRSSKDILGPAVDPNLYVRVDVVGDSDARQASIAAHEPRTTA